MMSNSLRRVRIDCAGMYRPHLRDGLLRRSPNDAFSAVGACQAWLRERPMLPRPPSLTRIQEALVGLSGPPTVLGAPGTVRAACALPAALGLGAGLVQIDTPAGFSPGEGTWVAFLGPAWVDDAVERVVEAGGKVLVVGPGEEDEQVTPPPGGAWLSDGVAGDGRFGALGAGAWAVAALCGVDLTTLEAAREQAGAAVTTSEMTGHPSWPWALAMAGAAQSLAREEQVHVYDAPALRPLATWAASVWGSMLATTVVGPRWRQRLGGRAFAAALGDEEVAEMVFRGNTGASVVMWESPGQGPLSAGTERLVAGTLARAREEGAPVVRVRIGALDAPTIVSLQVLTLHAAIGAALLLDRDPRAFDGAEALMPRAEVDATEGAE